MGQAPAVGIVMGSDSDFPVMSETGKMLAKFGVPHECRVLSAHRTPAQTAEELKPEIPPTLQPQPQAIKIPDLPKKNDTEAMLAPPPPPPRC